MESAGGIVSGLSPLSRQAAFLPSVWIGPLRSPHLASVMRREECATGVAMAFKLIESAQARWRAVNAPHLLALVRGLAGFENGKLVDRPDESGG